MSKRTITTSASAKRGVEADIASIRIDAVGEGDSTEVAHAGARDRAATIRELLKDIGIPEEQISIKKVRIDKTSEMFVDSGTDAEYRAVEEMEVNCAPEDAYDAFNEATEADGKVPSARFKLCDENRRRQLEEAAAEALEKARSKAERLASAEGLEIDSVQEVTTTDTDRSSSDLMEDIGVEQVDLFPAPIEVSETVKATYEVSEI